MQGTGLGSSVVQCSAKQCTHLSRMCWLAGFALGRAASVRNRRGTAAAALAGGEASAPSKASAACASAAVANCRYTTSVLLPLTGFLQGKREGAHRAGGQLPLSSCSTVGGPDMPRVPLIVALPLPRLLALGAHPPTTHPPKQPATPPQIIDILNVATGAKVGDEHPIRGRRMHVPDAH